MEQKLDDGTSMTRRPDFGLDWAVVGSLPILGWLLTLCYEIGVFTRQDVPISFIDIGIGQVLLTSALLLVASASLLQVADWISGVPSGQRRRLLAFLVYITIVGFSMSLWGQHGMSNKWLNLATAGHSLAVYFFLYNIAQGEQSILRNVFIDSLRCFRTPTLSSIFTFVFIVIFIGVVTAYAGYRGTSFETRDRTIVNKECGPLTRVVRKYGELLVVQEPVANGQPALTRLAPPDVYKNWSFRDMPKEEIEFRNTQFVGPCPNN